MSRKFLKFHGVGFRYPSAPDPLFEHISFHAAPGWHGIIGANGAGKTTLLKLATRQLTPDSGSIDAPGFTVYCAQRTDSPPKECEDFFSDFSKTANILRDRLKIQLDWLYRWPTLSHGERKRVQVASAMWLEPELLAVDEPFNHLDRQAREMIAGALHDYKGIGLLISHDRDILDTLCQRCLFLAPPNAILRPGGYSKAMAAIEQEEKAVERKRDQQKQEYKRIKKEALRRSEMADRSHARVSKKGINHKNHDEKSKRDLARLTGKDGLAGKLKQRMDSRLDQSKQKLNSLQVKKEYDTGIWFPNAISHRNSLFELPAGILSLGSHRKINHPPLTMRPDSRIALTGPNGSGKSTLIDKIRSALTLPADHITYIPQEISREESESVLAEVKKLPNEPLGFLMTAVRRLGSNPKQLLSSATPSPGEMRKLMLALGLTRKPHLIIMDEPTNHMDLPSIQCLEQALSQCPCGLLLVSHDSRFLQALTSIEWKILPTEIKVVM